MSDIYYDPEKERKRVEQRKMRLKRERIRRKKRIRRLRLAVCAILVLTVGAVAVTQLRKSDKVSAISTEKKADPVEVKEEPKVFHALDDVTKADASLTKYDTYGTSFNLEGTIVLTDAASVNSVKVVFRDLYEELNALSAREQALTYTTADTTISYKAADKITDGICMETIENGEYCMLLEVGYSDGRKEYHSFVNGSTEGAINYYTLTKNGSNNAITVDFASQKKTDGTELSYLSMNCQESELPENVYDIVIDAGHGGNDPGSINGDYTEAGFTKDYAQSLYEKLTEAGYKVLMTTEGTSDPSTKTCFTMYDSDGRVNVTGGSGAKYCICLHLNSNTENVAVSGVQVYCTNRGNTDMAKLFADNIVNQAQTTYSGMQSFKVVDGVYSRAYSDTDITKAAENANEDGYAPYDIQLDTDYFYMIRETGGLATGAYVDGRNTTYGQNEFRNSNQGVETFLVEMGYISEQADLSCLLTNKEGYVQAMFDTIDTTVKSFSL